ncbi:hypothetical protein AB5I41_11245 [Sphingomonas sp. MMS24-JH45]
MTEVDVDVWRRQAMAFDLLATSVHAVQGGARRRRSSRGWPIDISHALRPTAAASPSPPTAAAATTSG